MRLVVLSMLFYSTWLPADNSSMLRFELIQGIVPGAKDESAIAAILGKPTAVVDLKSLPGSRESGSLWEYRERGLARFSISFVPESRVTQGWAWTVLEGDKEKDLKTALGRFPGASWEAETVKWVNPHQVPMECYFKDKKLGVSIEYSRARKEVNSISRWNPLRNLSSTEEDEPPRFCIGGGCSDAKLSKDVFKDKPLCEVPNMGEKN